jgi:hypothetical protein
VTILGQSFRQRQLNQIDVSPTALTWNHDGTNASPKRENDNNTKEKHKDGGKKPPGPTQRKKSATPKTEPANTPNARIGTPPNARTGSTNTGTRPNRHAFKTFQGTADDEKRMLRHSIKSIISQNIDSHKLG